MKCVACLQGFNWECRQKGNCDEGPSSTDVVVGTAIGSFTSNSTEDSQGTQKEQLSSKPDTQDSDPDPDNFTTYKDDSVLRDQQSTGRKRAAKLFPLDAELPCDWKLKRNCGGGQKPITGCLAGVQQARHHGPDKNTLNNEKGNVHRICHTCHNRWHSLNDDDYVWGGLHPLHTPIEATVAEIVESEKFWFGRKVKKAKE